MCDRRVGSMRAQTWRTLAPIYDVPKTKYPPVLLKHVLEQGCETLEHYRKRGGYETWLKVYDSKRNPDEIVEEVFKAGLRGRGGAGFPTGQKWKFLAKNGKPRYLVVNADESEPGTFKAKMLIDRDPHAPIEGGLISGYSIKAKCAYIYIRGEVVPGAKILQKAVDEAEKAGLLKDFPVTVHRGAGAYICGEETGLLSSLEGNRGYPKIKPPFPAVEGLFRCPTIVNNAEPLSPVTPIIKNGDEWFRKMGTDKSPRMQSFSVCRHVGRPGRPRAGRHRRGRERRRQDGKGSRARGRDHGDRRGRLGQGRPHDLRARRRRRDAGAQHGHETQGRVRGAHGGGEVPLQAWRS